MTEGRTTGEERRTQLREFRRIISAAVNELRAEQNRNSYSALSLEELIDDAVKRLDDSAAEASNPTRLQKIRKIRDDLVNNIAAMRETAPEDFRAPDPSADVNTELEPEPEAT